MAKASDKTQPGAVAKKRSRLKLALAILVPFVLAAGAYGGWTQYVAATPADAEPAAPGHEETPADVVPRELKAETSFTHSFALSVLVRSRCGAFRTGALKAAADAEAEEDGLLANLSWVAAARRADDLTEKSCGYLRAEIDSADLKAEAAGSKAEKADAGGGGHH